MKGREFYAETELIILSERTIQKPYGWIYFYTSRRWLETRSIEYAIGGNGPLVVLRETGEIVTLGTARTSEEEIAAFEAETGGGAKIEGRGRTR